MKKALLLGAFLMLITSAARATAFITFTDDFSPQASALWSNSIGNWTSASGKYFAQAPKRQPVHLLWPAIRFHKFAFFGHSHHNRRR